MNNKTKKENKGESKVYMFNFQKLKLRIKCLSNGP